MYRFIHRGLLRVQAQLIIVITRVDYTTLDEPSFSIYRQSTFECSTPPVHDEESGRISSCSSKG